MKEKHDGMLWPVLLFLITVLTRLPFITKYFYHMDVAQFALGTIRYDISRHMPHPPGYILLVQVAKLLYPLFGDANLAFVIQSVIFSSLAVSLMYCLIKDMKDHPTGLFAALLLATNPLFWAYGETGYSYSAGAFIGVLAGFLSFRLYTGRASLWWLWIGGIILGVSGGFRPSDVFVVAPLWLFSSYAARRRMNDTLIAGIGLGIHCQLVCAHHIVRTLFQRVLGSFYRKDETSRGARTSQKIPFNEYG